MATVINNPAPSNDGGGMGFLIGIVLLIVFGIVFFIYGLPYLRGSSQGQQGTQINVPDKVDVNVNYKK